MKRAENEVNKIGPVPESTSEIQFFPLGMAGDNVLVVPKDLPRKSALGAGHYVTTIACDLAGDIADRVSLKGGEEAASIEALHMLLKIAAALSEAGGNV